MGRDPRNGPPEASADGIPIRDFDGKSKVPDQFCVMPQYFLNECLISSMKVMMPNTK